MNQPITSMEQNEEEIMEEEEEIKKNGDEREVEDSSKNEIESKIEENSSDSKESSKNFILQQNQNKRIQALIPENCTQKKRDFYFSLYKFLLLKNQLPDKIPIMGFKALDLYNLYYLVTSQGGYDHINETTGEGVWAKIYKKLDNYRSTITNASVRLKRYYQKFLLDYERTNFICDYSKIVPLSNTEDEKILSKIILQVGNESIEGEIYDTPTSKEILSILPFEAKIKLFEDVFYFPTSDSKEIKLEKNAKQQIETGELAYWTQEKSIVIGNGKNRADSCKLTTKCNPFGRLYTEVTELLQNDMIITIKPYVEEDFKKKRKEKSEEELPNLKKKRLTRASTKKGEVLTEGTSAYRLSIKYKFEGESDNDSRLIKMDQVNDLLTCNEIQKFLSEDNVNTKELEEIRYYEYASDDDSEGWALMTDQYVTQIDGKTRIKLKLKKGNNNLLFKRNVNLPEKFDVVPDKK